MTSVTGLSPSVAGLSSAIPLSFKVTYAVRTPPCTHGGLGSSGFARRYFRNRCFFLFLRLLRCFSSPGSPPYVMDWRKDTGAFLQWVSPFRYLRIYGYLLLPEAFRSLSRLSSALSAKASTLCSYQLGQRQPGAPAPACPAHSVGLSGSFVTKFSLRHGPASMLPPMMAAVHGAHTSSDVLIFFVYRNI